jgi:hypothetical protein
MGNPGRTGTREKMTRTLSPTALIYLWYVIHEEGERGPGKEMSDI